MDLFVLESKLYTDYSPATHLPSGKAWYVKQQTANRTGNSWSSARNSVQSAVNVASAGDTIFVAPGTYDETVTVPYAKAGMTFIGVGPRASASIAPSTAHAGAMIIHASNVIVMNLDFASPDTTSSVALTVTGNGFRAVGCKFEGAAKQVVFGPGTDAQATAHTAGHGGDAQFFDCEFAWGTSGLILQGTDYGAATQVVVEDCLFHNLTASSIGEVVGSGGSASLTFRNLLVKNCLFEPAEDGTEPTAYVLLNGSNSNTGLITGCKFTVASNSGKNLVSTAAKWVQNFYPAGPSTGQPS
jgi:hypothetical protein